MGVETEGAEDAWIEVAGAVGRPKNPGAKSMISKTPETAAVKRQN
jgi:hypothetical protein